ncbi:Nuclease domain-containing protein 1 [Portunus trituberculatus]|uniref:Staphylococcal nuclease domain-containing protein 1 n=1 Tax=Portunus trituberculatus TaxID=210409 RepID=A0A5B7DJE3_PORTR|nr:Nuclease domain-containing protein 1 [Portunus trituberculatus]
MSTVYLPLTDVSSGENLTETMVSEGLVSVRRESIRGESRLVELEEAARSQGKCPMNKLDSEGKVDKGNSEPFADEARFFTESRLLQRDLQVILETFNNNNFVGSIVHKKGNIAEALLREGFARCVDWSIATVTGGPEKLRTAEKVAKEKQLRLWQDYKPSSLSVRTDACLEEGTLAEKDKEFTGKVVEVVNGDALVVKRQDGTNKKIFLSSIRPPRQGEVDAPRLPGKNFRPLYDIPWLFEAREFLRKKLIGQKVQCSVDYIQPAQNNFPEKTCCTVRIGDVNVAEAMVSKGYATVIRYRQDDDQRASCYDDLLSAEAKASKSSKGLHNKKETPIHRVADLSSDVNKAKGFLPFLQRAGRTEAVVEFVASGSRVRLFIPRETCLITFLLAGISCPRPTRPAPGGVGGTITGEPYGEEAHAFTKNLVMQREVEIEVDSMDKGGNFIGWLHVEGKNLSVLLVEEGLSTVHFTAELSKFYQQLTSAQESAKSKNLNYWSTYVEEEKDEKPEDQVGERKVDLKPLVITAVTREGTLYGQYCSDGPALEQLMDKLRSEFASKPPLGGAYTPKKGDLCAAQFVDSQWYRAKVERVSGQNVTVRYVDYGNREVTQGIKCASLPAGFSSQPFYAHELRLALVKFSKDEDYVEDALAALMTEVENREVLANREYRANGADYVSLQRADNKADVAEVLLGQGLLLIDERKDKRFLSMLTTYRAAQESARRKHLNVWQYGDVTEDDAHEFGMER